MVRARRLVKRKPLKKQQEYDIDDPAYYKDEEIPDKNSSKYVEDKVEAFHNEKISSLLARGVQDDTDEDDEDAEEEVMPLTIDESDDEEDEEEEEEGDKEETDMESDLEGKKDDDLPNDMAWGSKRKSFYDSDYVSKKGKSLQEIETEDKEEEEEAKNIQKRLAANLSEEDYDLNLLEEFTVEAEAEKVVEKQQERIVKDLKTMSLKEKLKLVKKESPELLELIQDFKAKLTELKESIQPVVEMIKDGRIPPGKAAKYFLMKRQLYLNYCTNISFYLVLKAKRIPAQNHPVIERLLSYRNLINELGAVDARLDSRLRQILSGEKQDTTVKRSSKPATTNVSDVSGLEEAADSDSDEEANLRFYNAMAERQKLKRKKDSEQLNEDELVEEEMEKDGKRGITYQMSKNKGLTPKRKKIDRNPRVKHREKFRRAQIRRKGQVREVRTELTRYSGEWSGIRAGVKRSVKLK